jgi:hypothetical protein
MIRAARSVGGWWLTVVIVIQADLLLHRISFAREKIISPISSDMRFNADCK